MFYERRDEQYKRAFFTHIESIDRPLIEIKIISINIIINILMTIKTRG